MESVFKLIFHWKTSSFLDIMIDGLFNPEKSCLLCMETDDLWSRTGHVPDCMMTPLETLQGTNTSIHISPWEKENHAYKHTLGGDMLVPKRSKLGGGLFFLCSSLFVEIIQFD